LKTDSNFKLSKMAKIAISSIADKKARDNYKKFVIDAEATRFKTERVILKGNDKE